MCCGLVVYDGCVVGLVLCRGTCVVGLVLCYDCLCMMVEFRIAYMLVDAILLL